ncbi:MAG: response regulator transcription factor [Prosthecobacter sp.]
MKNKPHLSCHDWSRLEAVLRGLYAEGLTSETYVPRAIEAVKALVPGEFITYSKAHATGEFDILFSDNNAPSLDVLMNYMQVKNKYDLWKSDVSVRGGDVLFLRDYFSRRQFRDLDIFATAYKLAGLDNHCAIPLCEDEGRGSIFLSVQRKGADFTEEERGILTLLLPHLRNARALGRDRSAAGEPEIRHFGNMGLTPREMEVFYWVVEGKRNPEIATILKVRLDTVKGHVESIFQKLGVENRHAAIRHGLQCVHRAQHDELYPHRRRRGVFFLNPR